MPQTTLQLGLGLFDGEAPDAALALLDRAEAVMPARVLDLVTIAGLDWQQRTAYVLEHFPEARRHDYLCTLLYGWLWDGLDRVLDREAMADLLAWSQLRTTLNPETVRRRRQEIQSLATGAGSLLPDRETVRRRKARDGAGPPDRWRRG